MSIAFEHVSFSYDAHGDKGAKRPKRARKVAQEQTGGAFPSPKYALHDVSLEIEKGSFACVIGHTGSGKSTLIQHVNGILRPQTGSVAVDGLSTEKDAASVRRKVGLVFQYPEYQLFGNTVFEDVGFGLAAAGIKGIELNKRVDEALTKVGLDPAQVMDKSPFDFSGGQRRRISLAGVLAMRPEYLVLDEPMAGLDPHGRREVMGFVRSLNESGMTVVMVSHSMDDVASLADQVIVLKDGTVFADGTPEEVFSHAEELRKIGLGIPVTTRIAHDLGQAGFTFDRHCYTLSELADRIAVQLGGRVLEKPDGGEIYG